MSTTRSYRIMQGDTLRAIAQREYLDATRWVELASLNDLKPPHIIGSADPADRLTGTVIWGDTIRIMTPVTRFMTPPADDLYGKDVGLSQGQLMAVAGDLALAEGVPNLVQALNHRIKTLTGELLYHPDYGCFVQLALGLKLEPIVSLMGAAWVQEALKQEPRLSAVEKVTARSEGDRLAIAATVMAVGNNTPIDLNLVTPGRVVT